MNQPIIEIKNYIKNTIDNGNEWLNQEENDFYISEDLNLITNSEILTNKEILEEYLSKMYILSIEDYHDISMLFENEKKVIYNEYIFSNLETNNEIIYSELLFENEKFDALYIEESNIFDFIKYFENI